MTAPPDTLLQCDTMVARWSTQLRSDDIAIQEKARRRINYWLDRRLELMGEEDQCSSSQASVAA